MAEEIQQTTEGEVSLESFFNVVPKTPEVTTPEVGTPPVVETTPKTPVAGEEVEVVETPEVTTPETVVETPAQTVPETTTTNPVFDRVKLLIENGIIDDINVALTEDEEDEGVSLSEFKDITQEQLDQIKAQQKELKDKELTDKYISKDGLNDNHLKIVKFLKDGGDLKQVFENPEQAFKTPYEGLDLTDVKTQQAIALRDYMTKKGLSQSDAMLVVAQKQKDFQLDALVTSIVEADVNEHNERINNMAQTQEEKRKEKETAIKATRKSLTATFKENKIADTITKKVVDSVTKFSQGGTALIEDALKELLKNPEENYLTLLHVVDPKSFNELHKIKESKKVASTVLRLKDKAVTSTTNKIKEQQEQQAVSELEKLFKDVGPIVK